MLLGETQYLWENHPDIQTSSRPVPIQSRSDLYSRVQEDQRLFQAWKEKLDNGTEEEKAEFGQSLLNFYKEHSDFYLTLYQSGMYEIIMKNITGIIPLPEDDPNQVAYFKSCIDYMIYGYVREWMKRGMPESGDQLADNLDKIKENLMTQ